MKDTDKMNTEITEYLNQLGEKEKKAFLIAKNHLGTSFNISKSIGYIQWKKETKVVIPITEKINA